MSGTSDDLSRLIDGGDDLEGKLLGRVEGALACAFDAAERATAELGPDASAAERLDALLAALTGAAASDRDLARLCLVEAPGLGPRALARKDAAVTRLAALLARELGRAGIDAPAMATEMAAGGIHEVLQRRVAAPGPLDPDALAAELAGLWLPVLTGAR